jgi:hypothetical protein
MLHLSRARFDVLAHLSRFEVATIHSDDFDAPDISFRNAAQHQR